MKWAVVTGASSGIGKALALEFASHAFNIVLIGRNQDALATVAAECARKGSIETEIVATDLSNLDLLEILSARFRSDSRAYEVLVNIAGFGIHGLERMECGSGHSTGDFNAAALGVRRADSRATAGCSRTAVAMARPE